MALLTCSEISLGLIFKITVESYALQFSTLNRLQIWCLLHLSQNIKKAGLIQPCNCFQWIVQLLLNFWGRGGFNIWFCFLSHFYLTQNDMQKILSGENVCVWALVIYTIHIIINESWCLCSQCSQRSFKHKVSFQFLLARNVTTLH